VGTKAAWTPERRAKQAAVIRRTRPWEKSTGPRTEAGKAASSRNAYAGDWYHEAKDQLDDLRAGAYALFGRRDPFAGR
jgi:hypothetical protein